MDLHFLLTNDDGIEAPGLAALAAAVSAIPGATYTIAAPDREYSQCGHRVTTTEVLSAGSRVTMATVGARSDAAAAPAPDVTDRKPIRVSKQRSPGTRESLVGHAPVSGF